MRQSQLFSKTRREAPAGEEAKNAVLLIRGGFIHKEMAGVYSFLPLGLRVLERLTRIIREEMNAIGGEEILLSALQEPELWKKTGRWSDEAVDSWFKTRVKGGDEVGLGFTHEEPLTALMREHIRSWRDLPVYAYQIQTKFRNETRARSGLIRGREFLMKDLYSFSRSPGEHEAFYATVTEAYRKIFARAGIGEKTFLTFASGGSFSKYSHEFQTLCAAGEDVIYLDRGRGIAVNREVLSDEVLADLKLAREELIEEKAAEVGNIFSLGTRFSEALGLAFLDETGARRPIVMGSYGIGPTRLMGVVAELFADERGIVWPAAAAPFDLHLLLVSPDDEKARNDAEALYRDLLAGGSDVLYDDRPLRAGEKFADADLIGIPTRIVVSEKTLKEGKYEVKSRASGKVEMQSESNLLSLLQSL